MSTEARTNQNAQPLRYIYRTAGVCPPEIHFQISDGHLSGIRFVGGGCPGNARLVASLLEGRPAAEVARDLKGLPCRDGTSCPDQLARAIQEALAGRLATAESFRIHSEPGSRSKVALVGDLSGPAGVIERLIAHARSRGAESIYCLGNLTAGAADSKAVLKALRKGRIAGILGEEDWRWAHYHSREGGRRLGVRAADQLIRTPQVVQFRLGERQAVAFYGDYLQQLPGYSDFVPFALEINMVCGLTRFMQDESVFPALAAMTPQFRADIVMFSQPRTWGQWRVGGKDFIGVGPAWDGTRLAWGLLEAEADRALFTPVFESLVV